MEGTNSFVKNVYRKFDQILKKDHIGNSLKTRSGTIPNGVIAAADIGYDLTGFTIVNIDETQRDE